MYVYVQARYGLYINVYTTCIHTCVLVYVTSVYIFCTCCAKIHRLHMGETGSGHLLMSCTPDPLSCEDSKLGLSLARAGDGVPGFSRFAVGLCLYGS